MDSEAEAFRLLVMASRRFTSVPMMRSALFRLQEPGRLLTVVHSGKEGGETIARLWALERQALGELVGEEESPLETAVASADHALIGLVATAKNKGTRDCFQQVRAAGIPWALIIQR
jgi:hypothetical protein